VVVGREEPRLLGYGGVAGPELDCRSIGIRIANERGKSGLTVIEFCLVTNVSAALLPSITKGLTEAGINTKLCSLKPHSPRSPRLQLPYQMRRIRSGGTDTGDIVD
jgi:hypothetical protein